jgi:hypothetical protein
MKISIPFLSWTAKASLEIEIPESTEERWRLRAALEIAAKQGANLDGANLDGANLDGANLVRANLYGANLDGANLDGANLDGANLDGANLVRANLVRANLDGANLVRANLVRANLVRANLYGANLYGANLDGANLDGANLVRANLYGANLYGANLVRANLKSIQVDLFDILIRAQAEVPGLLAALRAGKVDGSTYQGDCACLVGTIANVRGVNYRSLENGLEPNSSRPAEAWFTGIKEGDTPETSKVAKITEDWIVEFLTITGQLPAKEAA